MSCVGLIPRSKLELARVEVAVDEHAASRIGTSEVGRKGEWPVADGFGDALSPVGCAASGPFYCGLIADQSAEVVEGGVSEISGEDNPWLGGC